VLALGFTASVAVAGLGGRAGPGASATPGSARTRVVVHVVRSGETLWDIARRVAGPEADPRPVVDRLVAMNHLRDGMVHPGDRLVLSAD
jgi:nucleoid-associated protein YgaU